MRDPWRHGSIRSQLSRILGGWGGALVLFVCFACGGASPEPEPFALDDFRPRSGQRILLNEPLSLTFSKELAGGLGTELPLAVLRADGSSVPGEWKIRGRWARFWPKPVLRADLSGGGYRAGERHRVVARGFPSLLGLRGADGTPLAHSFSLDFEVLDPEPDEPAFLDFSPFLCSPVELGVVPTGGFLQEVPRGEVLNLVAKEPLDPRSLHSGDFSIYRHRLDRAHSDREGRFFCGVHAVLVENRHAELVPAGESAARIEVHPSETLVPGTAHYYSLVVHEGARLADFGQNPAWTGPGSLGTLARFPFRMGAAGGVLDEHGLLLDFLEDGFLSTAPVPGTTGLAHWQAGRIVVRYPRAAGDGSRGVVPLEGVLQHESTQEGGLAGLDLHASWVSLAGLQSAKFAGAGPLVVRSQGSIVLEGSLDCSAEKGVGETGVQSQTPAEWLRAQGGSGTLSALIQHAQEKRLGWTILVAGGDLVVPGDIHSPERPVVLAAGGLVRLKGTVRCPPGQLYLVGIGEEGASAPRLRPLRVTMEPPTQNPLVQPLEFALVTTSLPLGNQEHYEWEKIEIGANPGGGKVRVRFLPADVPILEEHLVEHPRLLPRGAGLRILIQLTVQRGVRWRPPVIDSIRLHRQKK